MSLEYIRLIWEGVSRKRWRPGYWKIYSYFKSNNLPRFEETLCSLRYFGSHACMHLLASRWKFDKLPFLFWFHLLTVKTNCSWLSERCRVRISSLPRCINSQSSARRTNIFFFSLMFLFNRTGTSSKRRDCTLSEKREEQKVISLFKLSHKVHINYTGRSYALSYRIGRSYYVTWHVTLLTYISFLMYIFLSQANWDEHCTNVSSALHDVLKASQWESKAVPPDHLQVICLNPKTSKICLLIFPSCSETFLLDKMVF